MGRFGEFGQILTVINLANQALYDAAKVAIARTQTAGEVKVAQSQQALEAQLAQMNATEQQKQLLKDTILGQQQEQTIRYVALYGGIGLAIVVIILVLGTSFIKTKREEKYEYVLEKIK